MSRSDTARTTNLTRYKEFYNNNVYVMYMYVTRLWYPNQKKKKKKKRKEKKTYVTDL